MSPVSVRCSGCGHWRTLHDVTQGCFVPVSGEMCSCNRFIEADPEPTPDPPAAETAGEGRLSSMVRAYVSSGHEDTSGEVAELHLPSNAVAQASSLPKGSGFLIRVWPENGTHEYGGTNATVISLVVEFHNGVPVVSHINIDQDACTAALRSPAKTEDVFGNILADEEPGTCDGSGELWGDSMAVLGVSGGSVAYAACPGCPNCEDPSPPDPPAAEARAERAEAVVRLLVETHSACRAMGGTAAPTACSLSPGHDGDHNGRGFGWAQGREWVPSPWTPDLLAAKDEIAEGDQT